MVGNIFFLYFLLYNADDKYSLEWSDSFLFVTLSSRDFTAFEPKIFIFGWIKIHWYTLVPDVGIWNIDKFRSIENFVLPKYLSDFSQTAKISLVKFLFLAEVHEYKIEAV